MRCAWLGAFVHFSTACNAGGSTWAAEPPPVTPAAPPKDPRMQLTISPLDDPSSCVEGSETVPAIDGTEGARAEAFRAWSKAFKALVRARLAELGSCTQTLKKDGAMIVEFHLRADGTVERVRVPSTTLRDCRALECVRHGLSELKATPFGRLGATLTISSVALPAGGANGVCCAGPPPFVAKAFDSDEVSQSCLTADDRGPHEPTTTGTHEPTTGGPHRPPSGRLPPEQIQAVVRQHYGAFQHCYQVGLGRNSRLKGTVAIRFVIDTQGRVKNSQIARNDLPDCGVAQCVRDEMRGFHFPVPEGGDVTVVYPIMLEND